MEANMSSLAQLELCIQQLFSGGATNDQIQKIHQELDNFSRQKGAWKDALYFLSHTANQQTAMYSLTVLEGFITKGWHGLSYEEQLELRSTLYHWLLEKHQLAPYFIRNKAVQLVVHIGRSDWPERYPEFYNNILMLVSSPSTPSATLGLLFLQTTSEELGTPRDDLLSSRKAELKQRLLQLVPQTLSILTALLESIWEKHAHSITSTPPPSPTNPSSAVVSPSVGSSNGGGTTPLDAEVEPVARLALQCLTHLFSWIPLSSHVTPQLMELVFRFVGMGADLPTNDHRHLPFQSNELSVPVVALGAINEMLYKNCVPAEFENFVVLLFNNSCIILHHLVHNSANNGHLPQPAKPQFVEKLVELVHLLVSSHLRRLEGRQLPQFSVPQFLSLFFSFTFEQSDWSRYSSCLDTWQVFLNHLKQQQSSSGGGSKPEDSPAAQYSESLVTLSERVLLKVLYASNANQLDELDDEAVDGDMETERQKMLRQSIEVFVAAGELVDNRTLSLLNEPFQRCAAAYQSLAAVSGGVVRVGSKQQLREMEVLFRDLSSLLQLVGRLCDLHTAGPEFHKHFQMGKSLVKRLLDLASCGSAVAALKFVGCPEDELRPILSQAHAQCLSSLQAWCHWVALWVHSPPDKEPLDPLVFTALVASAMDVFNPAVWPSPSEDSAVHSAGLQLLSSVVNVIRSGSLWSCPAWNQLYDSLHHIHHLPPKIHRELIRCVLSSATVTWRHCGAEEQHWTARRDRLREAVDRLTQPTKALMDRLSLEGPSGPLLHQGKGAVLSCLALLADLASLGRDETTASKATIYFVIGPWIDPSLAILSYFGQDHEVTEAVFHLYLAVFDSLLSPLGPDRAEKAVQTFLLAFNQHNIQATLRPDNVHGIRAVEQLLRILQIVVQEPGAVFKRFLSSTLTLCLDHIYPCIAQMPATSDDLKETFYQLLTLVLRHNWRHFFKGSVLTTYGSREPDRSEPVENQAQLLAILTAYGQSFLLSDIGIFKQNLEALDGLQTKWKLYHKAIFRDGVAQQFVHTLLDVLANGSHELLREEMGLAIYAMASPDFDVFFHQWLPAYLLQLTQVQDHQKVALRNGFSSDTDLPSFTQNVHRLTNDLRCFRSANISSASLFHHPV